MARNWPDREKEIRAELWRETRYVKVRVTPRTWIVAERAGASGVYHPATKPMPSASIEHVYQQIVSVEVRDYSDITKAYALD